MSSINRWIVTDDTNGVSPVGFIGATDSPTMFRKVSDHTGRCATGGCSANLSLAHNPVAARATVTATGNGANGETLVIGGVTITIVTAGATGNQVNIAASPTALATALKNLINTSSSFSGLCTATSSGAVLTLICAIPGIIGNGLSLSETSASLTLTNLWGASVAGTEGTAKVFSLGL